MGPDSYRWVGWAVLAKLRTLRNHKEVGIAGCCGFFLVLSGLRVDETERLTSIGKYLKIHMRQRGNSSGTEKGISKAEDAYCDDSDSQRSTQTPKASYANLEENHTSSFPTTHGRIKMCAGPMNICGGGDGGLLLVGILQATS